MDYLDHLDTLNDITMDCTSLAEAEAKVKTYCEVYDIDPDGFDIVFECDSWVVFTAE